MDSVVQAEFARSPFWLQHPVHQHQLHVSDRCISWMEFARHQRRASERDLADLVWKCRDRYLYAQRLLHPGGDHAELGRQSNVPDLTRLYGPWDKICVIYRRYVFDPQIDFFEVQQERELSRWFEFRRRCCFDPLLNNPTYTRCILEAVGLLHTPIDTQTTSLEAVFECLLANILQRYNAHDPIEN